MAVIWLAWTEISAAGMPSKSTCVPPRLLLNTPAPSTRYFRACPGPKPLPLIETISPGETRPNRKLAPFSTPEMNLSRRCEFTDAVIQGVRYIDIARRIHSQLRRHITLCVHGVATITAQTSLTHAGYRGDHPRSIDLTDAVTLPFGNIY